MLVNTTKVIGLFNYFFFGVLYIIFGVGNLNEYKISQGQLFENAEVEFK